MWKVRTIVTSIFLTLLPFSPGLADSLPTDDNLSKNDHSIIITTSSRVEEPASETSGSLSIVTSGDIEVRKPMTVSEVVRYLPGIEVRESGTIGESVSLSIRGSESTQVLTLLNGVRVNSPFRGDFEFGNFFIDEIEQIEVVRGVQSVLYGSDAIGGVVNLRSLRPTRPRDLSLNVSAGNYNTFRENLSFSGKQEWIDYSFSASRTDSGGQFERDTFSGESLVGQIGFPLKSAKRLEIISRFQRDRKDLAIDVVPGPLSSSCLNLSANPDSCVDMIFDMNRTTERQFLFNVLKYNASIYPWWNLSLTSAAVHTGFKEENPAEPQAAIPWSFSEDTKSMELSINLQQDFTWPHQQILTLGVEYMYDRVESEISNPVMEAVFGEFSPIDRERGNAAFYIQHLFKKNSTFTLQSGFRLDNNTEFGVIGVPKMSLAYQFSPTKTRFRGSLGTGFRGPSVQDQYFPVYGNPDLEPEKSRSWEVGLQQSLWEGRITFDIAYFWIDYNDLIQRTPTGIDNIGKARTSGVESFLKIEPTQQLTIRAGYTYLKAMDRISGQELPFRSKHKGSIGLNFSPTASFNINFDYHTFSSQRLSADFVLPDGAYLTDRSPGYFRADLTATYYRFGNVLGFMESRIFFKIKNLFDRRYQEVPGFPSPGLGISGGMVFIL